MSAMPHADTYRAFAQVYDWAMGDRWFPTIHRSFEWAIRRYGIRFRSLADVGCGTGTFLKNVARPGLVAYGIDRAPAMLRVAADKTRQSGVRFLVQDVTTFTLPMKVDVITCNFDTLNYLLSVADLRGALARCHANLLPDGHLLFDMIVPPPAHHERKTVIQWFRFPGIVSRWTTSWSTDARRSVVHMEFDLEQPSGETRRVTEVHVQRWYPLRVIASLLHRLGFVLLGVRDMLTLRPIDRTTHWIKFVAGKVRASERRP
jgi:SAM-dependent methyltransferase